MKILGIPVSEGIAMYNIYKLNDYVIEVNNDLIANVDLEIKKFHDALKTSSNELNILKEKASKRVKIADLEVFSSHQLIVNDPLIINEVEELITKKGFNRGFAYKCVIEQYISKFNNMKNEYMSERSIDITDVYQRVIRKLTNIKTQDNLIMTKEVILVATDITPSLVLSINPKLVKGSLL